MNKKPQLLSITFVADTAGIDNIWFWPIIKFAERELEGVFPWMVPVVTLTNAKVIFTSPGIPEAFVSIALVGISTTETIFHSPARSDDIGWSGSCWLQEKNSHIPDRRTSSLIQRFPG